MSYSVSWQSLGFDDMNPHAAIAFLTWLDYKKICGTFTSATGQVRRVVRWQSLALGDMHPHAAIYLFE